MPSIAVHDAVIHYEEFGSGTPVLLFAPGGFNSAITSWDTYAYHPIKELADEFRLIAMDQIGAGRSFGPLESMSWDRMAAYHLGLLESLGIDKTFVLGGCIGCSYCFNIIRHAPDRILGAIAMNPIGENGGNFRGFVTMFEHAAGFAAMEGLEAVVDKAGENPVFPANNAAGPWANRIAYDPGFAEIFRSQDVRHYVNVVRESGLSMFTGDFVFSVPEDWMRTCPRPLQVFSGDDDFHPRAISEKIRGIAPDVEFYDAWKGVPDTGDRVKSFLRKHSR